MPKPLKETVPEKPLDLNAGLYWGIFSFTCQISFLFYFFVPFHVFMVAGPVCVNSLQSDVFISQYSYLSYKAKFGF